MSSSIAEQVNGELVSRGYKATFEYPGFILIDGSAPGVLFTLGDANDTWNGNACNAETLEPLPDSEIETNIPRTSTDVKAIADAFDHQLRNSFSSYA